MKTFCSFFFGVILTLLAAHAYTHPVPYTTACFQPNQAARQRCHMAESLAEFRTYALEVVKDLDRFVEEGDGLVEGAEEFVRRGVSSHEIGFDPESLKDYLRYIRVIYEKGKI